MDALNVPDEHFDRIGILSENDWATPWDEGRDPSAGVTQRTGVRPRKGSD